MYVSAFEISRSNFDAKWYALAIKVVFTLLSVEPRHPKLQEYQMRSLGKYMHFLWKAAPWLLRRKVNFIYLLQITTKFNSSIKFFSQCSCMIAIISSKIDLCQLNQNLLAQYIIGRQ